MLNLFTVKEVNNLAAKPLTAYSQSRHGRGPTPDLRTGKRCSGRAATRVRPAGGAGSDRLGQVDPDSAMAPAPRAPGRARPGGGAAAAAAGGAAARPPGGGRG